jgi:hypothetical protein
VTFGIPVKKGLRWLAHRIKLDHRVNVGVLCEPPPTSFAQVGGYHLANRGTNFSRSIRSALSVELAKLRLFSVLVSRTVLSTEYRTLVNRHALTLDDQVDRLSSD